MQPIDDLIEAFDALPDLGPEPKSAAWHLRRVLVMTAYYTAWGWLGVWIGTLWLSCDSPARHTTPSRPPAEECAEYDFTAAPSGESLAVSVFRGGELVSVLAFRQGARGFELTHDSGALIGGVVQAVVSPERVCLLFDPGEVDRCLAATAREGLWCQDLKDAPKR